MNAVANGSAPNKDTVRDIVKLARTMLHNMDVSPSAAILIAMSELGYRNVGDDKLHRYILSRV